MIVRHKPKRYQTTALGESVRWLGWSIAFVVGPIIYVLLTPRYGYLLAILGAVPCLIAGMALELLVIGPRAWVHDIFAARRNRSRNLLYAWVGGIFTLIGIWGFVNTHEMKMLFVVVFSVFITLYALYLAKAARE